MTVLTTVCAICVVVDAFQTVQHEDGDGNFQTLCKAVLSEKFTFVFGAFTLLCAWSLTSLLCFHAMIISVAQTTNERVRGVYRFGQVDNDADHGCCWNWYAACCWPYPTSRLPTDMSQTVVCDYTEPEEVWIGPDHGETGNGAGTNGAATNLASSSSGDATEGATPPRVSRAADALPPATV
jgi:hypothetical protein